MRSRSLTYKKTLILLCDNYPLSAGEFFIDDEMRVIAPRFDKVILYTASAKSDVQQQQYRRNAYDFWKENLEAGKNYEVFSCLMVSCDINNTNNTSYKNVI